jgi:hypothetical protein
LGVGLVAGELRVGQGFGGVRHGGIIRDGVGGGGGKWFGISEK